MLVFRKAVIDAGLATQVEEDQPKVHKRDAGRFLQLRHLAQDVLIVELLDLEVLKADEHRGQRRADAIMELACEHWSKITRLGPGAAVLRFSDMQRRRHPGSPLLSFAALGPSENPKGEYTETAHFQLINATSEPNALRNPKP
jgi:hypothetical protein